MTIHPLSDVKSKKIGQNTIIWQYSIVLEGATIGNNCNINCHTFIENDVIIGNNCTIKSGVYLWDGLRIGNDVFIGPNVTFTNDKYPKSKVRKSEFQKTVIEDNVSIGANSTILGGVIIGEGALIGAGSLITKNVPPNELWFGQPAKFVKKLL
jgi:UDP-2-acetamido-3-amino-2,3-dideoxy-glucuronate N-acetyltransferase